MPDEPSPDRRAKLGDPDSMRLYFWFLRYLSQALFALYFHGRVFGARNLPKTGGVLLASNHQSFFDPISATCISHREANYMARDTLFAHPLFRRLISSLNAFPVKRGTADVGAVKEILRRLRQGRVVLVFPEATRSRDGQIGSLNPNSLAIAKKAGVAIVPTVIDGAFEAWPRSQRLPSPGMTYVTYSRPITPEEVVEWPIEKIVEVVTGRMNEAMERSRWMRRRARCSGG